jgi:hypothetical protein
MAAKLISDLTAGRIIKGAGIIAIKVAAVATAAYALFTASHFNEHRSRSNSGLLADMTSTAKLTPRALSSSIPNSEQRSGTREGSCAGQTWPSIPPDCIVGRSQSARNAIHSIENSKDHSAFGDPPHTGSVSRMTSTGSDSTDPTSTTSSSTHETRQARNIPSEAYPGRQGRRLRRGAGSYKIAHGRPYLPRSRRVLSRDLTQVWLVERGSN